MTIHLTERHAEAMGLMSDWQRRTEEKTLARYRAALAELRAALQDVDAGSMLVRVDLEVFENFVHDELPKHDLWNTAIDEAV